MNRFLNLLSYPRSFIALAVFPFYTLLWSTLGLLFNLTLNNRKLDDWVIRTWARHCCKLFGVQVKTSGLENIPTMGCVFLFNHTSFFDIFAMSSTLPSFRYGAKIELFSIPVFGVALRKTGALPIARQNKEEVFKIYKDAQERLIRGEKFALSPEGGRQATEVLAPFKAGPFIFAINAKAALVPVIIKGASEVLSNSAVVPNLGRWSRTITVQVLKEIDTSSYQIEERMQLQKLAYEQMKPYFSSKNIL